MNVTKMYVTDEDREALEWVREHGGLDHVKKEWRSRVPYDRYERSRQRLLRHIAECETALGRRREIIKELEGLLKAFTNENAELRKRAMPEGCEWPRYEDGELVQIGDVVSDVEVRSVVFRDGGILLSDCTSVPGWGTWRSYKESIRRPAVLAADGEPLEVGQTVWDTNGDELVVGAIEDGGHTVACRYADVGDGIPTHGMWSPSDLTHQRPVLDAEGVPIREGDTVWNATTSAGPFTVREIERSDDPDEPEDIVWCGEHVANGFKVWRIACQLTHTKTEIDTWQRIEEDAGCTATKYNERRGTIFTTKQQVARDLVRRCHVLAERERGE